MEGPLLIARRRQNAMPDLKIAAEFLGSNNKERAAKCRALAAEAGELAAGAMNPLTRASYLELKRQWQELADEIETVQPKPPSHSSQHSDVVADFIKQGGEVAKLPESVPVSGPEVIHYLESCGVKVKYARGDSNPYVYSGRRCSLKKLIEVANVYRRAVNLPPFAATINIYVGRKPQSGD